MFCPNYKNKEVFDGFNEMIEAFGGKPMTEEEFRDSTLRNLRTGSDYSAMEAAYRVYHLNNGEFLDKAPNGKSSVLFQSLLGLYNGDRTKALQAKSKVYSKSFRDWFGDWLNEDKSDVSKVVDENGEPKIVYHGSKERFNVFNIDNFGKTDFGSLGKGFYFTNNKSFAEKYGDVIGVFLNIKNPLSSEDQLNAFMIGSTSIDDVYERMDKMVEQELADKIQVEELKVLVTEENLNNINNNDGVIEDLTHKNAEIVAINPNQIKSIYNEGSFSKEDNDINKLEVRTPAFITLNNRYESAEMANTFGPELAAKLLDGEAVSSKDVIEAMAKNNVFSSFNKQLSEILSKHDIPIKIDNSLGIGTLAETVTDKTGGSFILINGNLLSKVSKDYAGITILHETIHALTVNAINNPVTDELKAFVESNHKVLNTLREAFKGQETLLNSSEYGAYALTNEKEFAATYITDEQVRRLMNAIARQLDINKNGKAVATLKRFINNISNLLINRSVLASNEDMLTTYLNQFKSFLQGLNRVKKGGILSNSQLKELYKNYNTDLQNNEAVIEATKDILHFLDTIEHNKLVTFRKVKEEGTFSDISNKLHIRKNAIRTSNLNVAKKQQALTITENLINMYDDPVTPRYTALRATVSMIIPLLHEDFDMLMNIQENEDIMDSSEYMYQTHSNFSMFQNVFSQIEELLRDPNEAALIIKEYNNSDKTGSDITVDDLNTIISDISNISGSIKSALVILKSLNNKINARIINEKANKSDSIEGREYAAMLLKDYKFEDISSIWSNFGSIDSSTNDAVRILSSMLEDANNKAHFKTIDKAIELVKLAKDLTIGESVSDIYEKYKGKRTGYVVRELNFGLFYDEYDKAMAKINKLFGLDPDNRKAPDDPDDRIKWNTLRNKWLGENCERKYTAEYYEKWAKVPQCAKDALDSINTRISNLIISNGIKDENGYLHFDKFTDSQWKEYNQLMVEKRLLYSPRDQFGNLKEEGNIDYEIYKALTQLQQDLYPDRSKDERVRNIEAWRQAREKIIEQCGGRKRYERYLKEGPIDKFDDNRLRKWDIRNTKMSFREDEGHNVWDDIEEEFGASSPNYGPKYDKLTEDIKELLKPYRLNNKEIMHDEMSEAVRNLLKSLYEARNQVRKEYLAKNEVLNANSDLYRKIFEKYLHREDNQYIKLIQHELMNEFTDEEGNFDEDGFWMAMLEYGKFGSYDEGLSLLGLGDMFELFSWNQHLVANDFEKYMNLEPGDGWIEKTDDSPYLNENFNESYGSTMVPKLSKYKNPQWTKIQKSKTLSALHSATVSTITESNELLSNRVHTDNYLLPQVMASNLRRICRRGFGGFLNEIFTIIKEKIGIKEDPNSYIEYGENHTLDDYDSEGNYIVSKKRPVGNYADGRSYNTIPQYYTRKLEDPSMISSDLINMLISYYRMSQLYSEKSKIKNDCEAIVDKFQNSTFISDNTEVSGGQSNTFKYARLFLDMLMYGQMSMRHKIFNGKYEWSITILTLKLYTTAVNLGLNPKVAAVGFMTSMWTHLINAVTGQKYSKADASSAFLEVIRRIGQNLFGLRYINNHKTNDKLMLLMEELDISNQGEKKGEHTNRNSLIQAIFGNSTFGFLSTFDCLAKGNILVSTLKAHRFVDGEFLSKDDIEKMKFDLSESDYKLKLKKWKEGKNVYSILSGKNNKLVAEKGYEHAWNNSKSLLMSRVSKYAENADGMATKLLKALMTQSFVGSLVLIHRQYLGLMLQERYGDRVYDYDTRQYKNAIFKTAFNYITELWKNNVFGGGLSGAALGLAISGMSGASVFGTLGLASSAIYKIFNNKNRKSISDINKLFFGQTIPGLSKQEKAKDKKTYLNQLQNKKDIKRIIAEVIIYNALLSPLSNTIAQFADDDDEDRKWLQILAYWMRAFQWEAYAPYRPTELLGAIKSATAATSPIDKLENVASSLFGAISPQYWFTLAHPSSLLLRSVFCLLFGVNDIESDEDSYWDKEVLSGAYSNNEFAEIFNDENRGWTRRELSLFKLLPVHNLYELYKDSKRKRQYIENQIMHIKEDNSSGNSITSVLSDIWKSDNY